ncbi:MAG: hypothetical protein HC836_49525 [Richelia sp. RM2_1_2]|nr:hypothetical protein [Richelia sp. RM2_1_2]
MANTSTREQDVKRYLEIAKEFGYISFVITVENWHGGINSHDVPEVTLERMENQLKNSIKIR